MRRKILVIVILIALGFGSLSLYVHILRLDSKYTELVHAGTEQMRIIQHLTAGSNKGYILLMRMAEGGDIEFRTRLNREREQVVNNNNHLLDSLLLLVPAEGHDELNQLKLIRKVYRERSDQWALQLLEPQVQPGVLARLDEDLYPYFSEYQNGIQVLLTDRHTGIASVNAGYTAMARNQGGWMLAFAFSPIIIVGIILGIMSLVLLLVYKFILHRTEEQA